MPQLLVYMYSIVAVPGDVPNTIPEGETVAAPLIDDHTPPDTVLVSATLLPSHTAVEPLIVPASGSGLTVTVCVATSVPQLLLWL